MPKEANAHTLLDCLGCVLQEVFNKSCVLETVDKLILIGGGNDGLSVNIGEQNGMKGKLQNHLPWLFWAWCYGHCLEFACKDALSSNLFKCVRDVAKAVFNLFQVH